MHDATDMDLLRQYADGNSDAAFAALVSRHVDLVYSAALRKTGNLHAAEEITQAVFIILARKAGRILDKTILPGWLYQTARLTASSFLRRETRRVRREQEAYMQTEPYTIAPDETWEQLAPLLEDAMGQLGDKDRAAVVQRFFGGKSFAEVATAAGVSENAAKKRVSHALEKLHRYFARRGVSSTTAIIAGAISANSVQAAPMALAKSVTAIAVSKGAAASGSTLTLIKGALKIMAWTKAKTAIVIVGVSLATVTTPVVIHHYRAGGSIFSSTKELSDSDDARFVSLTGTTPEQAARTFLEACGREDWVEAAKYWPPVLLKKYPSFADTFKNTYGGMKIVSLGKPFRGAVIQFHNQEYAGVYVPYEIQLKDGTIKKWQLAIRCDNPDKHWYWDGGM
jgi:RNA polymerase sigma factor (sigma-70 family)